MISLTNNKAVSLGTSATITTSFANLGDIISSGGLDSLTVLARVDINDTKDLRVRCVMSDTEAFTNTYVLPIKTAGASAVSVEGEYYELNVDADINIALDFNLNKSCPFARIQIACSTIGSSCGTISASVICRRDK